VNQKALQEFMLTVPLFAEMSEDDLSTFAACGTEVTFKPDQKICKSSEDADFFYIIKEGRVAVELQIGEEEPIVIETLDPGEVLGWSWIFPPYKWQFDARSMDAVQAVAMDARCIRGKLDDNPRLGYWTMKQFSKILMGRLSASRLQMMDIYAT
jgi:CRP-like cAMP-binding protein